MKNRVIIARIARLVAKAIRLGADGFTMEERRQLAADLLLVAAMVVDDVSN